MALCGVAALFVSAVGGVPVRFFSSMATYRQLSFYSGNSSLASRVSFGEVSSYADVPLNTDGTLDVRVESLFGNMLNSCTPPDTLRLPANGSSGGPYTMVVSQCSSQQYSPLIATYTTLTVLDDSAGPPTFEWEGHEYVTMDRARLRLVAPAAAALERGDLSFSFWAASHECYRCTKDLLFFANESGVLAHALDVSTQHALDVDLRLPIGGSKRGALGWYTVASATISLTPGGTYSLFGANCTGSAQNDCGEGEHYVLALVRDNVAEGEGEIIGLGVGPLAVAALLIVALLVFGALGLRLFFNGREEWNVALVAAGTVLGSAIAVIAARQRAEVSFCLPLHYTRILLTF
jgi:hypothetical protein